jgi:3-oxoacyl-[acyl-carrier protein] reductase
VDGLARALSAAGATVTLLADAPDRSDRTALQVLPWETSSLATTRRSVDATVAAAGEPAVVVVLTFPDEALQGREAIEHTSVQWAEACERTMRQTIHLLQCLAPAVQRQRASIIFVGPSLGLVGCAGLAALVALLESQRGLMKALARQWGKHGVTCNWIALEARELMPEFSRFKLPVRLEAVPVALGRRPNSGSDLAGVVEFLGSAAGRVLTGPTLCLDGGEWMVP